MMKQEFLLKDGRTALLRTPTEAEAEQYLDLLKALAKETPFMLWEPEELDGFTVKDEAAFICSMNANPTVQMIVCDVDGVLAGEGRIIWDPRNRIRHRGEIMFGIRKDFWGQGIARAMFDRILKLAKENGITQLELEVSAENQRAAALYRKLGFRTTGTIPNALKYDNRTADIHIMVRDI